jgi:hypothetical protein
MSWLADRVVQGKYAVKFRSNRFAKTRLLPLLNNHLLAPAGLKLTRSVQPEIDFNKLLHGCRSALLRAMPKVSGTMLSAGCSGRWYFDWIAERTGHVGRHIGIELFSPKPDDLPANVEWIPNSVADMHGVPDNSCELVFSGQNIEHLWPDETVGFLLESWRVLGNGGWLIVDSPNRLLTAPLVWTHPEHTIEFTPHEAKRLLELGGFRVSALKGMWLCRDPQTGKLLSLAPIGVDSDWSLFERLLLAESDPNNSFLWWIEARKIDCPPDRNVMLAFITGVFSKAWPERCSRFSLGVGRVETDGESRLVVAEPSQSGAMVFGPYLPLKSGRHSATFALRVADVPSYSNLPIVRCDILGIGNREIMVRHLTAQDIQSSGGTIILDFDLPALEFGIQARCIALGGAKVRCKCWPIVI